MREALRSAVGAWALRGAALAPALLAQLNRLMAAGPTALSVRSIGGRRELAPSRSFADGAAVLAPFAETIARLIAEGERALAGECGAEDCSL